MRALLTARGVVRRSRELILFHDCVMSYLARLGKTGQNPMGSLWDKPGKSSCRRDGLDYFLKHEVGRNE